MIKVIKGMKPREVMKAVEEGKRWAAKTKSDGIWIEDELNRVDIVAKALSLGYEVAIIDYSQPVIDWDGFDWGFFRLYCGLTVFDRGAEYLLTVHPVREGFTLRQSPFYYWSGGKQPVPDNVEVEIVQVAPHTMKTICRDKYAMFASEVDWQKATVIAFRITGRVL